VDANRQGPRQRGEDLDNCKGEVEGEGVGDACSNGP
jgi:hypothetical protein